MAEYVDLIRRCQEQAYASVAWQNDAIKAWAAGENIPDPPGRAEQHDVIPAPKWDAMIIQAQMSIEGGRSWYGRDTISLTDRTWDEIVTLIAASLRAIGRDAAAAGHDPKRLSIETNFGLFPGGPEWQRVYGEDKDNG